MQQLYLTGDGASASAAQLMNALNVPFSGFQLTPVRVGGSLRGEALHLLLPPPKPRLNDVLCRVRLTEKDWLLLPQVMEEIAVPGLCGVPMVKDPDVEDGARVAVEATVQAPSHGGYALSFKGAKVAIDREGIVQAIANRITPLAE